MAGTAQAGGLPEHAFRNPLAGPGPMTGFYQVITLGGPATMGASATDQILGIVRMPYEFVICDVSYHALGATGNPTIELSHNTAAAIDASETAVMAAVDLGAAASGNVTGTSLTTRLIPQDQYLILHGITGVGEAITTCMVVITGYCTQHVSTPFNGQTSITNEPYDFLYGVENQQPGPVTGGLTQWNLNIVDDPGAGQTDYILGAWKVPFDFYVEELTWQTTAGADTDIELSHNTTLAIDGNEIGVLNAGFDISAGGVGSNVLSELYPTTYVVHPNAKVPKGSWLIYHATTGGSGGITFLWLRTLGFPYSHVMTDPADDV